jgi:amidohydrolase
MGGECNVIFREGYPAVVNDERLTNLVKDVAYSLYSEIGGRAPRDISGPVFEFIKPELIRIDSPRLAAEDFGFYSQKVASCLYWLGTGSLIPLHSSEFTINEDIAKITIPLMSLIALSLLQTSAKVTLPG